VKQEDGFDQMTLKITFVVGTAFELLDLSGPMSVFQSALAYHGAPYEVALVSSEGGRVLSSHGLAVDTAPSAHAPPSDTIVAVGGPEAHQPRREPAMTRLLAELAADARRVTSICTGAFYLAEAGLLDGHRATTHWRWAPLLQSRFPGVSVDADRIFIRDRSVWTSAGVTAGIDMALALVEEDCGRDLAKAIARELLVYYRRPGGQSQFSAILDLEPTSGRVRDALRFARENLQEHLSVERLAEAACVSSRQFARLFQRETGETPARAVERLRVEAARPRVEDTSEPIELIARQVGFGDAERMRRSFVRIYGHSPQTLRRIAQAAAGGGEASLAGSSDRAA